MSFDSKKIAACLNKVDLSNLTKICETYQKEIYYRRCGCQKNQLNKMSRSSPRITGITNSKDLKREISQIPKWITGKIFSLHMTYYDKLNIKNAITEFEDETHIIYTSGVGNMFIDD